jgi:LemA protein
MTLLIAAGVIATLIIIYIVMRNGLVAVEQRLNASWSGIEVQLKRRHDLIPNLVKSVKAAQGHEKGIIDAMLKARENAITALAKGNATEISSAESALTAGLRNFVSYAESNPQITATGNIATLQRQIEDTEDQVAAARRFYNASAAEYNTAIKSVPWNFIAAQMALTARQMIEFSAAEVAQINTVPDIAL